MNQFTRSLVNHYQRLAGMAPVRGGEPPTEVGPLKASREHVYQKVQCRTSLHSILQTYEKFYETSGLSRYLTKPLKLSRWEKNLLQISDGSAESIAYSAYRATVPQDMAVAVVKPETGFRMAWGSEYEASAAYYQQFEGKLSNLVCYEVEYHDLEIEYTLDLWEL